MIKLTKTIKATVIAAKAAVKTSVIACVGGVASELERYLGMMLFGDGHPRHPGNCWQLNDQQFRQRRLAWARCSVLPGSRLGQAHSGQTRGDSISRSLNGRS